jgi:hypothetical protein
MTVECTCRGPPNALITPISALLQKNLQKRVQKMSSIYRRNDGLYVAQFVDQYGKQKYLYARKRKDVKAKLAAAMEAQEQGLKRGADKLTLSEYLADWLSATESTVSESS